MREIHKKPRGGADDNKNNSTRPGTGLVLQRYLLQLLDQELGNFC